jgi:hypothetical protein
MPGALSELPRMAPPPSRGTLPPSQGPWWTGWWTGRRRGDMASALSRKPQSGTAIDRIAPFAVTLIRTSLATRIPRTHSGLCQRPAAGARSCERLRIHGGKYRIREDADQDISAHCMVFVNNYFLSIFYSKQFLPIIADNLSGSFNHG